MWLSIMDNREFPKEASMGSVFFFSTKFYSFNETLRNPSSHAGSPQAGHPASVRTSSLLSFLALLFHECEHRNKTSLAPVIEMEVFPVKTSYSMSCAEAPETFCDGVTLAEKQGKWQVLVTSLGPTIRRAQLRPGPYQANFGELER